MYVYVMSWTCCGIFQDPQGMRMNIETMYIKVTLSNLAVRNIVLHVVLKVATHSLNADLFIKGHASVINSVDMSPVRKTRFSQFCAMVPIHNISRHICFLFVFQHFFYFLRIVCVIWDNERKKLKRHMFGFGISNQCIQGSLDC